MQGEMNKVYFSVDSGLGIVLKNLTVLTHQPSLSSVLPGLAKGPQGAVYDNPTQCTQKRNFLPSSVCLTSKFKDMGVIILLHL